MTGSDNQSPPFFSGLQPSWLSWDRLYRVYVSDKMLAGAYIAGQIHDEQSAAIQLQQLRILFRPLVRQWLAQRQKREAQYEAINPFAPQLLNLDPRNFQILRSDVARTRFRRNRSLWTPRNVGTVELELHNGTTRRLILVGDQEPEAVLRQMQRFDPVLEVTGTPNPLPPPKKASPAERRRLMIMFAAVFLGSAAIFGYVAWAGIVPKRAYVPIAVVNVVCGAWAAVKAWKISGSQSDSE